MGGRASGFFNVPVCRTASRRPTDHVVIIGSGSSRDEQDAPEGRHLVPTHFGDGWLGGDDLRRLCVVSSYLLLVENGEVPGVTEHTRDCERV